MDVYAHMEPLLRALTRERDTMRTRKIRPGEDVESLWEKVTDERNEFFAYDINGNGISYRTNSELSTNPYMFYSEANVVEDQILFPDELVSNNDSVPFRQIRNGIHRIEGGILPSKARHLAKGMEALSLGGDPLEALDNAMFNDEDNMWALTKIWESGMRQVRREKPSGEQRKLLKRTGLYGLNENPLFQQLFEDADYMEVMERDRSFRE